MICCDRRVRSPPNDFGRPGPACWRMWRPTDDDWTIVQVKQKPQIKHVWFNMYVDHFERVTTSENVYAELGGRGVRSPIILFDSSYV
jgi:hypothetical protein